MGKSQNNKELCFRPFPATLLALLLFMSQYLPPWICKQLVFCLSCNRYPVQAGDAIWMAPFVPQWWACCLNITNLHSKTLNSLMLISARNWYFFFCFRYAALGKSRTRYLLYKDVNRNPVYWCTRDMRGEGTVMYFFSLMWKLVELMVKSLYSKTPWYCSVKDNFPN